MSDPANPWPMLVAMAAAALVASAAFLFPRRFGGEGRSSVRCLVGAATGFYIGCGIVGMWPKWPPVEDRDRLLLVLFPCVIVMELLAALPACPRWGKLLLRLPVALSAAPILLHNSVYLTQSPGPDSIGWTSAQQVSILGGLALALGGVWAALNLLAKKNPGRSLPLALAVACAGAAVSIMLSGYATCGPVGLLLAAAILGAMIGSLFLPTPPDVTGVVGPCIVGVFSLVVVGRFFGELTSVNALLLMAAPLLCWVPELPYLCRLGPRLRGVVRLVLIAAPLAIVLSLIQNAGKADQTAPAGEEPGIEDYQNFGK